MRSPLAEPPENLSMIFIYLFFLSNLPPAGYLAFNMDSEKWIETDDASRGDQFENRDVTSTKNIVQFTVFFPSIFIMHAFKFFLYCV